MHKHSVLLHASFMSCVTGTVLQLRKGTVTQSLAGNRSGRQPHKLANSLISDAEE